MDELTPQQQQEVEQLFERTLEVPAEQRIALLDSTCNDPAVRAEVESLLAARPAAEQMLKAPIVDSGMLAEALEALSSPPETFDEDPDQIGPYRILSKLGEGGMGSVYLAEQTEPLRRRVAIKLIKLGMDTRAVIRRFEAERHALALMNHPNVARAFDAGVTADGRPYFVMEYVEGRRITEYCDRERLDVNARLDLFSRVCHAIQHAHQKGIIHRDIKPSNVLVCRDNGQSVPKVIDFGVAKATDRRLTEQTLFTEQGVMIGTPEYMSPEQADPSAADIDTRSDIYSLGVLLYELLVGTPPMDGTSLRRVGLDEIRRIIREQEVVKPSTRVSSLGAEATAATRHRRANPSSLQRQLRGDLDWIAMKCLEKDRERRYTTPAELIDDITRYLHDQPVVAGRPTLRYRAGKFVRRNRGLVGAASAVFVVLVAGILSTTIYAARESRQRILAQTQAETARAVNRFLNNMLASVDPTQARGRDVGVLKDILGEAAAKVETELSGQPQVEASVRRTIGQTYMNLGLYAEAEPHLERALEIERASDDGPKADLAGSLYRLGILRDYQGRSPEGESLLEEAVALRRDAPGPDDADLADGLNRLAMVLMHQGRLDDAKARLAEAITILNGIPAIDARKRSAVLNTLASCSVMRGASAEAEALFREALTAYTDQSDHPDAVTMRHNLARAIERQGRFDEAEERYREALEATNRIFGTDHPVTLKARNSLAAVLEKLERYADSEALHREVLAIRRRVLGDVHPDVHNSLHNLGSVLLAQQKIDECITVSREALALAREVHGPKHPVLGISLGQLGFAMRDTRDPGNYAESERLILEALSILESTLPAAHPFIQNTLRGLKRLYAEDAMNDSAKLSEVEARLEAIDMDRGTGGERPTEDG